MSSRVGLWFVPLLQVLSFQSLLPLPVLHQLQVLLCTSGEHCTRGPSSLQPPSVAQADLRPSLLVLQPAEQVCGQCLLVPKPGLGRKEGSPSRPRKARPSYDPGSLRQTRPRARAALEFPCGFVEVRCMGLTY